MSRFAPHLSQPAYYVDVFQTSTYTLVLVDPDAPTHSLQNLTFYLHWIVTDVQASTDINVRYNVII